MRKRITDLAGVVGALERAHRGENVADNVAAALVALRILSGQSSGVPELARADVLDIANGERCIINGCNALVRSINVRMEADRGMQLEVDLTLLIIG
jgi:hypothetical protein